MSCRIAQNASTIVCPVIDTIDWNNFEFYMQTDEPMIGGFDWRLTFQWHSVPEAERQKRKSRIEPIRLDRAWGLSKANTCTHNYFARTAHKKGRDWLFKTSRMHTALTF